LVSDSSLTDSGKINTQQETEPRSKITQLDTADPGLPSSLKFADPPTENQETEITDKVVVVLCWRVFNKRWRGWGPGGPDEVQEPEDVALMITLHPLLPTH